MFNQYPYLNLNDLNLDYLLNEIKSMYNEVTNFVSINAIKYANPIQWNITRQYEKNTVVIDPLTGTAYISVAAVPSGVALTRAEYWTVVFDLGSFVTRAAQNFTEHWESDITTTATFSSNAGDWLVWGDVLYKALTNITAGDTYVIGSNIEHFTIEDLYNAYLATINNILASIGDLNELTTSDKTSLVNAINSIAELISNGKYVNVRDYGAVGDGTTDDATAFQDAANYAMANNLLMYVPCGNYRLASPISIEYLTVVGDSTPDTGAPDKGSMIIIDSNISAFILGSCCRIIGLSFYYPMQDGAAVNPIVYPPTIQFSNTPEMDIANCIFCNSYIAISNNHAGNTGACGRISISGVRAYAVDTFLDLKNSKDSVHVTNCFITCGVFEDIALTSNAYLAKYTNNNGTAIKLTDSCDDLKVTDCIIYGYLNGIYTDNADVNMLKVAFAHFDNVIRAFKITGTAKINNSQVIGCQFFNAASRYTGTYKGVFEIDNSGASNVLIITNNIFECSGGGAMVVIDPTAITLERLIFANNEGHAFATYGLKIDFLSVACINGNIFRGSGNYMPNGIEISSLNTGLINNNDFVLCTDAIKVTTAYSLNISGNVTINTAANSLAITSSTHNKVINNTFDATVDYGVPSNTFTVPALNAGESVVLTWSTSAVHKRDGICIIPVDPAYFTTYGYIFQAYCATDGELSLVVSNPTANNLSSHTVGLRFKFF